MDEITIGDKLYVSSKRAAQITGYAKDYIGQLCREGRVEARLVGRNWYVLDSALREHRFGKAVEEAAPQKEERVPESPISTWKRPEYVPETPVFVPTLTPKPEKAEEVQIGTPAIADMQTAWREWFQEKKDDVAVSKAPESVPYELPVIEKMAEPEPSVQNREPEVEEVAINRIEEVEAAPVEEVVEIHREYRATAPVIRERISDAAEDRNEREITTSKPASHRGVLATQIVLVMIAIFALGVAVVGTGHAEKLLGGTSINFGFQKVITDYLGGKSEYKSSL